ncbi:gfo/Idh/MocA family oxidoreductase [Microbacterium sp. TPD7012]|uniref:gfo/Idh/MocA family oxidoreductase n=1 Tax=Microbacterium sp. TPD7012 TaxID=2171975 RepID=UPI000D506026|nr:gfo/Idh/MocA family oxidoreductase [Microbacterium sp. TPD7012]PVE98631.1 dehydrogenase [Microbacterium sp. TPD7012]
MTSPQPIRFGLIGVDSSHARQFTRLFGDGRSGRVLGGVVTAAWKAPTSADFPPSRDRNDENASALSDAGVPLLDSPEAVAEASDALLLVSSDVRTRREQFARIAPSGKPVYVDTRFAADAQDASEMLQLAADSGCLVLSGSPKRFTPEFLALPAAEIESIELRGPLVVQPGHPGLSWYGVHLVDLAVALFGPGRALVEPRGTGVRLVWPDGRSATLSGPAEWDPWTRGRARTASGEVGFTIESDEDMLTGLLDSVVRSCRSGEPNIDPAEIVAISRIVAAGSETLATRLPLALPKRAPDADER